MAQRFASLDRESPDVERMPANLVAVHDLLSEALAIAEDAGRRFDYGLALYPRPGRFDAKVFGVVTRSGESTTLTYRLLQPLMDQPVWISGRVAASLRGTRVHGAPVTPTGLLDQPVLHLLFTLWLGPRPEEIERTMPFDSTIYAGELRAPIVLLLERRPSEWPL